MSTFVTNFDRNLMFKSTIEDKYHDVFNPDIVIKNKLNGLYYIEDIDMIKDLLRIEYDSEFPSGLSGFMEVTTYSDFDSYNNEMGISNEIINHYNKNMTDNFSNVLNEPIIPDNYGLQDYYFKVNRDDKVTGYADINHYNRIYNIVNSDKDTDTIIPTSKEKSTQSVLIRYKIVASNGYEYECNVVIDDKGFSNDYIQSYMVVDLEEYKYFKNFIIHGRYIRNARIVPDAENEDFAMAKLKEYLENGKDIKELGLRFLLRLYFKTTNVPASDYANFGTYASAVDGLSRFNENYYRNVRKRINEYLLLTDLYAPDENEKGYFGLGNYLYNIDKDVVITRGAIKYNGEWYDPTSFESPYKPEFHSGASAGKTDFNIINGEILFSFNNQFPVEGLAYDTVLNIEDVSTNDEFRYDQTPTMKMIEEISGENTYYFATDYLNFPGSFKTRFKLEYKKTNIESEAKLTYFAFDYGTEYKGGNNINYISNTLQRPGHSIDADIVGENIYRTHQSQYFNKVHNVSSIGMVNNSYYFYKNSYSDFLTVTYDVINPIQVHHIRDSDIKTNLAPHNTDIYQNGYNVNDYSSGRSVSCDITVQNNIRPIIHKNRNELFEFRWRRVDPARKKLFSTAYKNGGYYLWKEDRLLDWESYIYKIGTNTQEAPLTITNEARLPDIEDTNINTGAYYRYTPLDFVSAFNSKLREVVSNMSIKYRNGIPLRPAFNTSASIQSGITNSNSFLNYLTENEGYIVIRKGAQQFKRTYPAQYQTWYKNVYDHGNDNPVEGSRLMGTHTNFHGNSRFREGFRYGDIRFSWEHYKVRSLYGREMRRESMLSFIHPTKFIQFT